MDLRNLPPAAPEISPANCHYSLRFAFFFTTCKHIRTRSSQFDVSCSPWSQRGTVTIPGLEAHVGRGSHPSLVRAMSSAPSLFCVPGLPGGDPTWSLARCFPLRHSIKRDVRKHTRATHTKHRQARVSSERRGDHSQADRLSDSHCSAHARRYISECPHHTVERKRSYIFALLSRLPSSISLSQ